MSITRIKNNQITDLTVNAAAKLQDYSITSGKIANNLTYNSNLTVAGNLDVTGTTTTIDTVDLVVEDPLILLAKNQTGTPTLDIGFIGKRGTEDNIAFVWDQDANQFITAFTTSEITNTIITINSYASFQTANLTAANGNITGNLSVGNISLSGNIDSLNVTGNVSASNFLTVGTVSATGTGTFGNVATGGTVSATANITGGNLLTGGSISATGNVDSGNVNTGIVSASGNILGGNLSVSGSVTAASFVGNISGNIDAAGANTQIQFNTDDLLDASANLTFDKTTNSFTVSNGNITGGNLLTGGTISATSTITGGNLATGGTVSATGTGTFGNVDTGGTVSATSTVTGGNLATGGTVSATGTGTFGNVDTGGTVSATGTGTFGNVATGGTVSATGNITGGNVSTGGLVTATGNVTGGNLFTAGIVDGGSLTISGNAVIGGNLAVNGNLTYVNVEDLRVEDPIIQLGTGANGAPLTINDGKDRGTQLVYFNTGESVQQSAFFGWDNNLNQMFAATNVTISNEVVTVNDYGVFAAGAGQFSSASATGNITGGNIITVGAVEAGTISSSGTITGGNLATGGTVSATGNITGGNVLTGGLVSSTGNVTGGNILTDGLISATGNILGGNLSVSGSVTAASFVGNISGNIDAAGANTQIQFNDTGDVLGASANLTFDKAINSFTVSNGNITGGNLLTGGVISATSTITGGNLATSGTVSATGTITGGNVDTGGTVSATGTGTFGNVDTGGTVSATGTITGGNLATGGTASVTGNITGGNVLTGGLISATGNITGANLILTSGTIDGPAAGRITVNSSGADVDFAIDGDTTANVFYVDAGLGTVAFGNGTAIANAIVSFNTTDSVLMPVGNLVQRPNPASIGMLRFSTTLDQLEVYTSTGWEAAGQPDFTVIVADEFTGNGTQTQFTLTEDSTTDGTIVSINGVVQQPITAYSVSGNVLTFTEAPELTDVIDARILTTTTSIKTISNNTGNAEISVSDTSNVISITGAFIPTGNATANIGSATNLFNRVWAVSTSAVFSDLAEMYAADAAYEPGVVVVFGGTAEVTAGSIDADPRVAGVISTAPSYLMNSNLNSENAVAVALTGRVPTKVIGTVRKGDMMVSALDGHARAETNPHVGTVIGKALEDFDPTADQPTGVIEVVVGRI